MLELPIKLKIIKTLTPEVAAKLRTAAAPIEFLRASKSSAFLSAELGEAPYSIIKCGLSPDYRDVVTIPPIMGFLGASTLPSFAFSSGAYEPLTLGMTSTKKRYQQVPITLNFQLKNNDNKLTPVTFGLEIKLEEENFKPKECDNTYFSFKVHSGFHQNYIFNIAAYFYNKYSLYKKVKTFLTAKQAELLNISNSATFVATLLALFSAEKTATFKVKLPKENLNKELLLLPATDEISNYKSLFKYLPAAPSFSRLQDETDQFEVLVGEKTDTLAIVFTLDYGTSVFTKKFRRKPLSDITLTAFKLDQQLDTLINATLATRVENYLAFSDFASKLIATVKTKFLLDVI